MPRDVGLLTFFRGISHTEQQYKTCPYRSKFIIMVFFITAETERNFWFRLNRDLFISACDPHLVDVLCFLLSWDSGTELVKLPTHPRIPWCL